MIFGNAILVLSGGLDAVNLTERERKRRAVKYGFHYCVPYLLDRNLSELERKAKRDVCFQELGIN